MEREIKDIRGSIRRFEIEKARLTSGKVYVRFRDGNRTDITIRPDNLKEALDWVDIKYQRLQDEKGYSRESQIRIAKTMEKEITLLKNILYWFNHKPLTDLTVDDFLTFYRGFEKGEILSISGKDIKDKVEYYNKVFRGDKCFFGHLGKNHLCKKVMLRCRRPVKERPWFTERELETILQNSINGKYRLLFGLMFDTGIEIDAVLKLVKEDFTFVDDKENYTYRLHVPKEIAKATRQVRDMDIIFPGTKKMLNEYLPTLKEGEFLFDCGSAAVAHQLRKIVDKFQLKVKILERPVRHITLKDFRSSLTIHMLNIGLTVDQIKRRLGHSISSKEIDSYVNLLGLNDEKERKLVNNYEIGKLVNRLDVLEKFIRTFFDGLDIKNLKRDQSGNWTLPTSRPIMIKTDGKVIPSTQQGVVTFDNKGVPIEMDWEKVNEPSLPIGSKVEKIEEFYGEG